VQGLVPMPPRCLQIAEPLLVTICRRARSPRTWAWRASTRGNGTIANGQQQPAADGAVRRPLL